MASAKPVPGSSPLYQTIFNMQPPKPGDAKAVLQGGMMEMEPISSSTGKAGGHGQAGWGSKDLSATPALPVPS